MKILSIISLVLLACTLICGMWMKFGPIERDTDFHAVLAAATIVLSFITIILYMVKTKV